MPAGNIAIIVVMSIAFFIMVIFLPLCLAIVFKKAGRSPWNVLVNQWNIAIVLAEIARYERSDLSYFNPIRNFKDYPQICLGVAENFGRGPYFGVGLALLPPIFYAILAFNKNIKYTRPGASDSSAPTALHSIREYYEREAAETVQSNASGEVNPTLHAVPGKSATAPLPPLPPLSPDIDDSAAQDCFVLAGELEAKGEKEKAIEQYTKAIHLNSRHTAAYFRRGMLLMEVDIKPASLADFERVVEFADNPELTDIAKANVAKLG